MFRRPLLKNSGPIILASFWLIFTASLVGWWWLYGLNNATNEKTYHMILWEGGFLFFVVLLGGGALLFYTRSHQLRHIRLKLFFSHFAHDLKTSISRLRLQSELLEESHQHLPQLKSLLENVQRLDLQLENSLWMASLDDRLLQNQECLLSDVLKQLRSDFVEINFTLKKDARLLGDHRAVLVVFRNIIQNSRIHGEANSVTINVIEKKNRQLEIEVWDNGKGLNISPNLVGLDPLQSFTENGPTIQTNGIGLHLTKKLLQKMNGDYEFVSSPRFTNKVIIQGNLAGAKS